MRSASAACRCAPGWTSGRSRPPGERGPELGRERSSELARGGGGRLPRDPGGIRPQSLERVVLARLREEHVHDEVAVVEQDPGGVTQPFDAAWRSAVLALERQLDLVTDRAHLT